MRYSAVPWTLDGIAHPAVVHELADAGLHPAGCLVDDLTTIGAARLVRGHRHEARRQLLAQVGRPCPVLLSADRTVATTVSDLHGSPAVRMRTFLADGSLVETERRWDAVPPWPGRQAPFRHFTTVDREMARSVAPGRTLVISTSPPRGQLDDHHRHVAAVAERRGSRPTSFADIDGVADGWNAALAHEVSVMRRADGVVVAMLLAGALVLMLVPRSPVASGSGTVALLALAALVWWATPGVVVLLRRRLRWRPAFAAARASDVA